MAPSLGLDPLVIALVLLAALLHASWNAVLKVASDRVTTSAVMNLTGLVAGGILALFFTAPESPSWIFILLSVAIHFAYFLFLLGSYRYGDLSQVYPLARGVAPLIVAFLSPWLIGEHLGSVVGDLCLLSIGPHQHLQGQVECRQGRGHHHRRSSDRAAEDHERGVAQLKSNLVS